MKLEDNHTELRERMQMEIHKPEEARRTKIIRSIISRPQVCWDGAEQGMCPRPGGRRARRVRVVPTGAQVSRFSDKPVLQSFPERPGRWSSSISERVGKRKLGVSCNVSS